MATRPSSYSARPVIHCRFDAIAIEGLRATLSQPHHAILAIEMMALSIITRGCAQAYHVRPACRAAILSASNGIAAVGSAIDIVRETHSAPAVRLDGDHRVQEAEASCRDIRGRRRWA